MMDMISTAGISKLKIVLLALLGFAMTGGALMLDLHDFVETPWYLWLWVPICSLYPLLLTLNYSWFLAFGRFPKLLLRFTVFGAISYGVIAPVFYTLYMIETGFSWYEFGNIWWVWLYAAQGVWLARYAFPADRRVEGHHVDWQLLLIFAYFLVKDPLDRFSITWSYVRFGVLSESLMNQMFVVLLVVHVGLTWFFWRGRRVE